MSTNEYFKSRFSASVGRNSDLSTASVGGYKADLAHPWVGIGLQIADLINEFGT